ncbi:MAG: membrane protein insertion efficiency factor YidD [Candidatus Doudnabacteria bacterium]|nr:membrane protein insertion efficiency factor YidD [Candidatus Doudnabacteria bacterium]
MREIITKLTSLPKKTAVALIKVYQATLSPDHGLFKAKYPHGYCRHYPTCSEYSKQAITKFGLIKGGALGVKRVLTCNPFVDPKVDPIP